MRIAGFTIPEDKRIDISLTYLYGIGRKNVGIVLEKAQVDPATRVHALTEDEQKRVQKALETYKLEGDLRAEVTGDIKRMREIGSYRGMRHARGLPAHGQRTRSNARTKRGKRVTIGAVKKDVLAKMEAAKSKK